MNSAELVHPRFLASVNPQIWPSLCTIQATANTLDTSGGPAVGAPVNITGLINIPCREVPLGQLGRYELEKRLETMTLTEAGTLIELRGHYPAIITRNIAVVDGVSRDILGTYSDGNHTITILHVTIINP